MNRTQAMRCITQSLTPATVVVCTLGKASNALYSLGDRAMNFYMLGSFGMAASLGVGLALVRTEKVVVIDGDGAILYNLGCLATVGWVRCSNLIHIICDNKVCESTGSQPTATSAGIDLASIGRSCGIDAIRVSSVHGLRNALKSALDSRRPQLIVVELDDGSDASWPRLPLTALEIKTRFRTALGTPHGRRIQRRKCYSSA
jgi:thiamine pyrophosphate-dependent acetolactate synthase large subunit-like protein